MQALHQRLNPSRVPRSLQNLWAGNVSSHALHHFEVIGGCNFRACWSWSHLRCLYSALQGLHFPLPSVNQINWRFIPQEKHSFSATVDTRAFLLNHSSGEGSDFKESSSEECYSTIHDPHLQILNTKNVTFLLNNTSPPLKPPLNPTAPEMRPCIGLHMTSDQW